MVLEIKNIVMNDKGFRTIKVMILLTFLCCFSSFRNQEVVTKKVLEKVDIVAEALKQLGITYEDCYQEFLIEQKIPSNRDQTILIIPKINILEEDDNYFSLDSYILIVDSNTGIIKNKFFESRRWESDALFLDKISIDVPLYQVAKDQTAFGVRVRHRTQSQPNPYAEETISLFLPTQDKLEKILDNFITQEYSGEWNMICEGKSTNSKKVLIMSTHPINGFFDIKIDHTIIERTTFKKGEKDCEEKEEVKKFKELLVYTNNAYKMLEKKVSEK